MDSAGKMFIENLRQKWVYQSLVINCTIAVSLTALSFIVIDKMAQVDRLWLLPLLIVVTALVLFLKPGWRLSDTDVAKYLNKSVPHVEESAGLLLKPYETLSFLEKLQVQKMNIALQNLDAPNPIRKEWKAAFFICFIAAILFVVVSQMPYRNNSLDNSATSKTSDINTVPEKKLPAIQSVLLTINPPSYTGVSSRRQTRFNFSAEENSMVTWAVETSRAVDELQLIINGNTKKALSPLNKERTKWTVQMQISKPGFYQVQFNNQLSELYRIEMVKDEAPVILIQSPASGTLIKSGEPKRVNLNVNIADDYGVKQANIVATIASGNGEAVKFKEQQLNFAGFNPGSRQNKLSQPIDPGKLGMQPGDELYFYVQATDYFNQQSRSDIIIITLEDTAQLMSMDGLVMGLDIKPELFRSQRQIIIESEQLLKDKSSISVEEFNAKSNSLAIDQQLLRLRYGKFLGEETNTEIGGEHEGEHHDEGGSGAKFGDANAVLDQFSHKHDIAEDATFFDAATKKQLKATLAEMWSAEGKLRLYKPAEALPFEYNALRLLKDLQQKSRVYVAKTSSKTPPLKPAEKRLTGELDKITQPTVRTESKPANENNLALRSALGVLEQLKQQPLKAIDKAILQQAGEQLSNYASADPAKYLAGLEAFKKIMNNNYAVGDIIKMQKSLQLLLQVPGRLPFQKTTAPVSDMSAQYFKNLKNGSR